MNCCVNCFKDSEIIKAITAAGKTGDCDFCSAKNVAVCDIFNDTNPIAAYIMQLVDAYSISDKSSAKMLKYALRDDWDIFAGGVETIQSIVTKICEHIFPGDSDIFNRSVEILTLQDSDFLLASGVVKGRSWKEFSDSIKYGNRFHTELFNADVFASFLSMLVTTYTAPFVFYRARISSTKTGFTIGEMGAPPPDKRSAGRINPEGVGIMYLSSDDKTVLSEVRANTYDYVTIGRFVTTRDINVVNLSGFPLISPFQYTDEIEKFAVNRKVFEEISAEIAKPMRRNDSSLEYLPTQYISEFIKSKSFKGQAYDGVEYSSTLKQGGTNIALFIKDSSDLPIQCESVETVEIAEVNYKTKSNQI
jgi:hypothetical protein